jgi:hypothetical protein
MGSCSSEVYKGHLEKLPQAGMAQQVEPDQHMSLMGWFVCVTGFFEVP